MARRPLIAGNWKMNCLLVEGTHLAGTLVGRVAEEPRIAAELLVCPPATLLAPVGELLRGTVIALGGQDCHAAANGAHTGDVAAEMLADAGCTHVIVGHSERRADHGETDATVGAKAAAALRAGLVAIVCVGETAAQREAGEALEVVRTQVRGSVPEGATPRSLVLAYEPVWAIGTGKVARPEDVAEMHAAIRRELAGILADGASVRILYGGSVKPDNAAELLGLDDVDGALVGGASLKADDFWAIAKTCG
ncbi:MAG: triose-phosphate isomerase [Alphaproteobacteria bacterium]